MNTQQTTSTRPMDYHYHNALKGMKDRQYRILQAELMGNDPMTTAFNRQMRDGCAGEDEDLEHQGKEQVTSLFPQEDIIQEDDSTIWTVNEHVSTAATQDEDITAVRFKEANNLSSYRRQMVTKTGRHQVLHFQGTWEFKVWQARGRKYMETPDTNPTTMTSQKIGGVTGAAPAAKHAHQVV